MRLFDFGVDTKVDKNCRYMFVDDFKEAVDTVIKDQITVFGKTDVMFMCKYGRISMGHLDPNTKVTDKYEVDIETQRLTIPCSVYIYPEYQKQGLFTNFVIYAQSKFTSILFTGVGSRVTEKVLHSLGFICLGGDWLWCKKDK